LPDIPARTDSLLETEVPDERRSIGAVARGDPRPRSPGCAALRARARSLTSIVTDAAIIVQTLERVAERVSDPAPLVFERLFRQSPEVEALFVRDTGGLVRGQMFQVTIESLLDFLGDRAYGANLIEIERVNHVGLRVEPAVFDQFYLTVMATFKTILGADWTSDMEQTWSRVVGELTRPVA
jgi:hemoglobin-like flavoprotein